MPGPGGGSRGGGFGGGGGRSGGGFGGGHRPGGFGGGHSPGGFHRPHYHHHHFFPFFGFHRPYYGYGYRGGCLGGLMGMAILPIILIFIAISLIMSLFGSVGSSVSNIASGGDYILDDSIMEEYSMDQYAVEFKNTVEYEDNILLVFLVDENNEDFYTMAIVGYNIHDNINNMFGGKYTEYGQHLTGNLNPNYKETLSRNLASTVRAMTDEVVNLRLKSSFYDDMGSPGSYQAHVTNKSNLEINEKTINTALEEFTAETDIPIVVVIDDMSDVFEKKVAGYDIITVLFAIAIGGVAIYFIVRAFKDKDEKKDNGNTDEDDKNNSTYW